MLAIPLVKLENKKKNKTEISVLPDVILLRLFWLSISSKPQKLYDVMGFADEEPQGWLISVLVVPDPYCAWKSSTESKAKKNGKKKLWCPLPSHRNANFAEMRQEAMHPNLKVPEMILLGSHSREPLLSWILRNTKGKCSDVT